jgi:dihydroxy-acid dehydratase
VSNRLLNVAIDAEELVKRKAQYVAPDPVASRGYVKLYIDHVQQAHLGADMDFLRGGSGDKVVRDSH